MTYDAGRGEVVLFGGATGILYGDTWVWDGSNWTQRFPLTSPPARLGHAMSYDATRGETVLFGGYPNLSDTWIWDGANWTQRFPVMSPAGRSGHGMAYDAIGGRLFMFGGERFDLGQYFSDAWSWDGNTWTQLFLTNGPSARAGHVMAYDEVRGEIVLFGSTGPTPLNDTWVINPIR